MPYTLVTGASSGIGEEFAKQLAKEGHDLILVARTQDKLNQLANTLKKSHNVQIEIISQDLSKNNSAEELFEKCKRFDINFIINNAGAGHIGEFEDQDLNEMEKMMLLNMITPAKFIYLMIPMLQKNKGRCLNVASQIAFEPGPYMSGYTATKAFMLSFTESLREEFEDKGIKFYALCPGPTYTNFFKRAGTSPEAIRFKFRQPNEVVEAALNGVENDKGITIPGAENSIMTFMNRFLPRSLLAKLSSNFVKKEEVKK